MEGLEAQALFRKLGYRLTWNQHKLNFVPYQLLAFRDGFVNIWNDEPILFEQHPNKPINLIQLRDLTVLHSNSKMDANYIYRGTLVYKPEMLATEYSFFINEKWQYQPDPNFDWCDFFENLKPFSAFELRMEMR